MMTCTKYTYFVHTFVSTMTIRTFGAVPFKTNPEKKKKKKKGREHESVKDSDVHHEQQ